MESLAVLVAFILSLGIGLVVARTALTAALFLMSRNASRPHVSAEPAANASLDLEAAA